MKSAEADLILNRSQERAAKLALAQLGLSLRALAPNYWLMPILALAVCVIFSRWIAAAHLVFWYGLIMAGAVPLMLVAAVFQRRKPEPHEAPAWIALCTIAYFLFAVCWASMGYFLWAPKDDLNHMLVVLLLAGTIAGNGSLTAACKPLAVVSYVTAGTALVLAPLQAGGFVYNGIAVLALLYLGYLVYMSREIFRTSRDMLRLKDDKTDLIVALAAAKVESDQARARAEKANLAKSQFLANMSHELRTPLNAILGFSEIISARAFKDDIDKHCEYAELIHGSGRHLLALINDILDLAKIEAGGFELRESEIDLARIIEDAMHLVRQRAQEGQCVLAAQVAPDLPFLFADERATRQILLNLLSNAVKFTLADGCVTAFARCGENDAIVFGVRDTGIGIAPADQERVFENFGQGRHDVAIMDKGTGLGLSIVKGLAGAHGGSVDLESAPGKGTCVSVTFPASRARARVQLKAAS